MEVPIVGYTANVKVVVFLANLVMEYHMLQNEISFFVTTHEAHSK
jgi:hypothetical protein